MNVKDYAQYMLQKHQLAIATAVIKTKPADLTYETYIDGIRNKINATNMDSNLDITICDDDFNISDDFTQCDDQMMTDDDHTKTGDELNKSHDSVTILRNFDLNDLDDPFKAKDDTNDLLDVMTQLDSIEENSAIPMDTSQINFTQQTNFDESQIPINVLASNKNEIVDNIRTICETYVESNHKISNNVTNVIDNGHQHVTDIDKNHSNATLCQNYRQNEDNSNFNENNAQSDVKNTINIENNNKDSQRTILYTLQGFTDNTHVSQSQEDFVIAKPHLLNRATTSSNICNKNIKENIQNSKGDLMETNKDTFVNIVTKNMYSEQDFENLFGNNNEILDRNTNSSKNKNTTQDFENVDVSNVDTITIYLDKNGQRKYKNVESDGHNDNKRLRMEENKNYSKNNIDSSEYTEFSQFSKYQNNIPTAASLGIAKNAEDYLATCSQNNDKNNFDETCNGNKGTAEINLTNNYLTQDFAFLDQYSNILKSRLDLNTDKADTINFDTNTVDDFENQFYPLESQSLFLTNPYDDFSLNRHESDTNNDFNLTQFEKDMNKNKQSHKLLNKNSINIDEPIINLSQNVRNVKNYKVDIENKRKECASSNKLEYKVIVNNLPNDETEKVISHNETVNECVSNENTQIDVLENEMCNNETDSKMGIVSFKTLEALNKIKCYLNRRERWLSEGVNSLDSGFKSSNKSASQHSDIRINESAHCLLSFVTASQMTDQTAAIADETSKILGKLVDKLHEEEKYPNFLEELLETVNVLLNDVYEGNNEESNTLLKKDDAIYRLLLLNRSTHIINYSIEKIITILEKLLSDLKGDILELKHIDKIENICYIFHILEVILKRVKKSNELSQMSVQNSLDDERSLKKSSLTEIWRKKWNLTKNEIIEGSAKKKCVLTKCSEVLNQIIVQAMDGYSLVSFAALQCFNLLQH